MSSTSATPPTGAPEANGPKEYYINFNQDCTSLSVGSKSGYRLFSLNNVETLEQIYSGPDDAYIVERLFCSSLVAIVTLSIPRKLRVCHFKKGTEICNYSYSNAILGVKLNRARLVVCLEGSLYIHNIRDMKVLHTIRDTPPNHRGLCALSISSDNCFIAYPGSLMIGQIQIFDAVNLSSKTEIKAHDSQLAALGFSPDGTRVASASEKGTVIRVFSVENSTKLYEFRRGVKRCVAISCLKFSLCGQFLACSSNTATIHIFKMDEPKESPHQPAEDNSWMGYFSNYLPSKVTDVLTQGRAFATAYLPVSGGRNVIAITTIQQKLRLLIAMEDGRLLIYNINTNEGGDLTLVEEHQLAEEVVESAAVTVDGPKNTSPKMVEGGILGSYAGIVKGNPMGQMSESEKLREMAAAIESSSPPKESSFQFTDKQEYPPLTQNSD